MMVRYVPDELAAETIPVVELPDTWRTQETWTQERGDRWREDLLAPLLRVPSVIVPFNDSPDMNLLISHRHPAATQIRIARVEPFALDVRLF